MTLRQSERGDPRRIPRTVRSRDESFDIWHEVPMVPQLTGMSCWAAAAAMIIGWRDCLDINPEEVARAAGRWSDYRDGMHPAEIDAFARTWGLHVEPGDALTVPRLRDLLEQSGPLWVGEASCGLHVIVVTGAFGDGTPEGSFARVLDPWPEGRGERYVLTVVELIDSLHATVELSRMVPRILHAGGRGCGASRSEFRVREEASTFVRFDPPAHEEEYPQARFGTPYGVLQRYAPGARAAALEPPSNGDGRGHKPTSARDPATVDDTDWYTDEELQGPPTGGALLVASDATWADDTHSPDYRHLGHAGSSLDFELSGIQLRDLFLLNGFDITAGQDEVLFGLRGCALAGGVTGEGRFQDRVVLTEDLPDHVGYHCVLGVFRQSTGELAVFSASTVPNWSLMEEQRTAAADAKIANLLPTGCYRYQVGVHRAVRGAFILQPNVLVLRTRDNLVYDVGDAWEIHSPADNIHPGFTGHGALFSSAGCQTIPGTWTAIDGHQGAWADFRIAAGLQRDAEFGMGRAYVYCLLTGRDARLMGEVARNIDLARLRFGSQGFAVRALQQRLADTTHYTGVANGHFDGATALAFVRWQQDSESGSADGIVTPGVAADLGVDLLSVGA